ncbi:hypothetical protein ACQPW3_38850 [Actinosynnema sp. CA-248983]
MDGDLCKCGRQALIVYVITKVDGTREVPYCGIPDGGERYAESERA